MEDDDAVWEVTLSYRLWRNLHLQTGYADLGAYRTAPVLIGGAVLVIDNPFASDPPRLSDPVRGFNPFPGGIGAPIGGVSPPQPARLSMEAHAWLLGLKVDHEISDRLNVYARAGALRAGFGSSGGNPPEVVVNEPDDRTGWVWGAGIQYRILSRVAVGAAFSAYDVKLMELDSYQLTLAVDLL